MRHPIKHHHKTTVLGRRNKKGLRPRKHRGIPQPYANPGK